jgi:Flp pilus assembly protein TadG
MLRRAIKSDFRTDDFFLRSTVFFTVDAMTKPLRNCERGNAMVEFAISGGVLFSLMFGTFQFGYTFYIYDGLQAAVRAGTRYACTRTYKSRDAACIAKVTDSVKNMVVYGDPAATSGTPIVRGLATSNVNVNYNPDANGVPSNVTVSVSGFTVNSLFSNFTLTNKPAAVTPYVGRYAPNECEP